MQTLQRKTETQTSEVNSQNMQISINNFGHLTIRYFDRHWDHCIHCGQGVVFSEDEKAYVHMSKGGVWTRKCNFEDANSTLAELDPAEKDTLIVFTQAETERIVQFIRSFYGTSGPTLPTPLPVRY